MDYTKRPSQIAINSLKRGQLDFRRSNVEVVCIQVAPVDEQDLIAWKKENKISFPVYVLPGQSGSHGKNNLLVLKQNSEIMKTLRREWGVRSLPWTILTDENQKNLATGLDVSSILNMLYQKGWLSPHRNTPLGDKIRRQDSPHLRYRRPTGSRLRDR
ncbi:MAG: hypothetical protein FVQ84_10330 [Planctomycetes bacterium]|nr:hypothetical protein [Planctomycetota bacterium]